MSVTQFSAEAVSQMAHSIAAHARLDEELAEIILESKAAHHAGRVEFNLDTDDVSFKLVHYMRLSNLVAYSIQYQEPMVPVYTIDDYYGEPLVAKELAEEIDHWIYNVQTNAGTALVDPLWFELFQAVRDHLAAK